MFIFNFFHFFIFFFENILKSNCIFSDEDDEDDDDGMNKSNTENKPIESKMDSASPIKISSVNEKSAIQSNGTPTTTKSVPIAAPNNVPTSAPIPIPQSPVSTSHLTQHPLIDIKTPVLNIE